MIYGTVFVITIIGALILGWKLGRRNVQPTPNLVQNPPAAPAAGGANVAPVAGRAQARPPFAWYRTIFFIGGVSLIGFLAINNYSFVRSLLSTSLFFPLVPLGVLMMIAGWLEFMKGIRAWIPSALMAIGTLLVVTGFWSSEFYPAVEGWVKDQEACAAGRVCKTTTSSTTTSSRQASVCGADKFVELQVNKKTPVRFNARLACRVFAPSKSVTASLLIRYNDGTWQKWEGNTPPPQYPGTVRYMDVLGTGTVKVQFGL